MKKSKVLLTVMIGCMTVVMLHSIAVFAAPAKDAIQCSITIVIQPIITVSNTLLFFICTASFHMRFVFQFKMLQFTGRDNFFGRGHHVLFDDFNCAGRC